MTTTPFEVPTEMRDFAERSVEQARKAFEGFVNVAQKAVVAAENATGVANSDTKGAGAKMFGFAEQNVNAAFDFAQKLAQAKDPQEAFAIQSEFLRSQMQNMQHQSQEIATLFHKAKTPAGD